VQKQVAGNWLGALEVSGLKLRILRFRFFIDFDSGPTLARVHVPVLSIVGDKDLQVPPKENAVLIEAALKKGDNKNFTVLILPGLNHLFSDGEDWTADRVRTN
jgi:pimeloyl-ACP methyl ester carboxylesterase